ncbi:MAG: glycoside hydrolase family 43 protein [Candidatus Methylacidiphilales bacterium]|nr:glycoside hydrolase family 43 protein [Candidatus Methylacidiphilales bacterium]
MNETLARTEEHSLFANPIVPTLDAADPWIVVHNGMYYYLHSGNDTIEIRRAQSIKDLYTAEPHVVWHGDLPLRSKQMWAPELHFADGRWYLYYCASDGNHLTHRNHVLESESDDPMGPFHYKAKLLTDEHDEHYAIDANLLTLPSGKKYLLWAGFPGHQVFIRSLENPWTTRGPRSQLPCDGFGCAEVREGPVCLVRNGRVFLFYSMCDVGKPCYRLGMIHADVSADLLDPSVWTQHPEPMLQRHDAHGVFGPGHNGFFTSPDGTQDWIVYHAKSTPLFTYRYRSARIQQVYWTADGFPQIGDPLPLGAIQRVPSGDPGGWLGPVW